MDAASPAEAPVLGPQGFTVTSCFTIPPPLLLPPILPIGLAVPRCWGTAFFGIIVMAELVLNGSTLLTFDMLAVRFIEGTLLSEKMDRTDKRCKKGCQSHNSDTISFALLQIP